MNVFVGCSSRDEIDEAYLSLATEVGDILSSHHFVIGGTFHGMMGRAVKNIEPSHITQIILKDYVTSNDNFTPPVQICDTSFERMEKIWDLADAFVILPGGTGTLGEIITFLEENRMKSDKKKIIVLNFKGYYDFIIEFVNHAKAEKFCNDDILNGLIFVDDIESIPRLLEG